MTNSVYPEMRLNNIFAIEIMQPEMKHDSSPLAHLLTWNVETPSEIRSMFDSITYNKGKQTLFIFYNTQ